MRLLVGEGAPREVTDHEVAELYRPPAGPWLRANMVSTLDGSATGPDGRSGSINNGPDHVAFRALRGHADAIVVGAGTARDERYGPAGTPLVLVSRRAQVPEELHHRDTYLATCASAAGLDTARQHLGDRVLVLGEDDVDLTRLRPALHERGWDSLLCEGGPSLLTELLEADQVDELCLTTVPTLVAGDHPRILAGEGFRRAARLEGLVEAAGTLLGRWRLERSSG